MSQEIFDSIGFSSPKYGEEMFHIEQPFSFFQKEFENEYGQIIRMEIIGATEDVHTYLATLQFDFRIERLDVTEEQPEGYAFPEELPQLDFRNIHIRFEFPYEEPPFNWEILLDPDITGLAKAHMYQTSKSDQITATVYAKSGSLSMSVNGYASVNAAHGGQGKITIHSFKKTWFNIAIDGFDESNAYDLYVSGATHKRTN